MREGVRSRSALAASAVVWASLAACGDGVMWPDMEGATDVEVVFAVAGASGGPATAFSKTQSVHVILFDPSNEQVLFEVTVPVEPAGDEIRIPLALEGADDGIAVLIAVELLFEQQPIFVGSGSGVLRLGSTEPLLIRLAPVANAIVFPADPLVIEQLETGIPLDAAVLFATEDTIPGAMVTWTSQDPNLVEIVAGTSAVAHRNGSTSLVAFSMGVRATLGVVVQAPLPPRVSTGAAAHRTGRGWAGARPVRGRRAPEDRHDPTLRRGSPRGPGSPRPARPGASASLSGSVNPNGFATQAWFEWGTDGTMVTFESTSPQSVGSGTATQSFSAGLANLERGTTYFFRASASNAGGTRRGTVVSFTPYAGGRRRGTGASFTRYAGVSVPVVSDGPLTEEESDRGRPRPPR